MDSGLPDERFRELATSAPIAALTVGGLEEHVLSGNVGGPHTIDLRFLTHRNAAIKGEAIGQLTYFELLDLD